MVVDSYHGTRALLSNMLQIMGYENVLEACDEGHASRLLERCSSYENFSNEGGIIDVVFVALREANLDAGMATTRSITCGRNKHQFMDSLPIVLGTISDLSTDVLALAKSHGITGFLKHPFEIAELQSLIHEHCIQYATRSFTPDKSPTKNENREISKRSASAIDSEGASNEEMEDLVSSYYQHESAQ